MYFAVSGQTYTRKLDAKYLMCFLILLKSVYKFSNDLRLLQSIKEIEEPFEKKQIGSSAMAYKKKSISQKEFQLWLKICNS